MKTVLREKCNYCHKDTEFNIGDTATLYREATCKYCGVSIRKSDVIYVIREYLETFSAEEYAKLRILNLAAQGHVHELLKEHPGYICGEYLDGVKTGDFNESGIRCVDLQEMPFENDYFDLIISEDVLEHVESIDQALIEINRVLKKKAKHIFTVPIHEATLTESRKYNTNKVYHGDPLRKEGALVVTDFGKDIAEFVDRYGMKTTIIERHRFHKPAEISYLDFEYEDYCRKRDNDLLSVFRYNSQVIVSEKIEDFVMVENKEAIERERTDNLEFTGERFVPGKAFGQIEQEHLQRYYAVKDIVRGKKVLDAACGAGYGSAIMAEVANSVTGIDISAEAIAYDKKTYADIENLQYIEASITELPFANKSFDVIVSFETIEHVDEGCQQQFLKEIKRCLKEDGILVMSSPDKANYSDEPWMPGYNNPYHVKEFYFEEFKAFLQQEFSCCKYYLQGEQALSGELIHPCEAEGNFPVQMMNSQYLARENDVYIIAVCSNRNLLASETVCSMYSKGICIPVAFPYHDGTYRGESLMLPDTGGREKDGTIYSYRFSLVEKVIEGKLRFDPIEGKCCIFELCEIKTDVKNYRIAPINAYKSNLTEYTFLTTDPQIEIMGDFQGASYIELSYKLKLLTETETEIVNSYEEILADMKTVRSTAQVFVDTGQGFNEEESVRYPIVIDGEKISFDVDLSSYSTIVGLRLDVCEGYYVFCREVHCSTDNGLLEIAWHNADHVTSDRRYCFYTTDPQMIFRCDRAKLRRLRIEFSLEEISSDYWALERVQLKEKLKTAEMALKILNGEGACSKKNTLRRKNNWNRKMR